MFLMRPATGADTSALTTVIRSRAEWMRDRDMEGWDGWYERAASLAGQASDPTFPVWVLTHEDTGQVIGCTSLFEETPQWGWTDAERAEPALFLATTCTDPAWRAHQPGALIAWWSLGHAARNGREWVRRGCGFEGLVRYYRDVQGFDLIHTVERHGYPAYLLARKAEEINGLNVRTATL